MVHVSADTMETKCLNCGRQMKVPAGKRRYMIRHGKPVVDFCSRNCNVNYIAKNGTKAQKEQQLWNSQQSSNQANAGSTSP